MTLIDLILAAVFVLLQAFDCYTTYGGLKLGLKESNPLAKWLIRTIGLIPSFVLVKGVMIVVVLGAAWWFSYASMAILGMGVLVSVYIVGRNYQLIHDITD